MGLQLEKVKKLLGVSLVLNAVLTITFGALVFSGRIPSSLAAGSEVPRVSVQQDKKAPSSRPAPRSGSESAAPESISAGTNQVVWIERLRASGAPKCALVAAVLADIDQRWQKRFAEANARYMNGEIPEREMKKLCIEQEILKEQELRNTLGEEEFIEWDKPQQLADLARLHLSDEEADKAYGLRRKLVEDGRKLELALDSEEIDEATYERLSKQVRTEFDQRVRELVGAERCDSSSEDSGISPEQRRGLRDLRMSGAQTAAVEQLETGLQKKLTDLKADHLDQNEYLQQSEALRREKEDQVKKLLGDDTYELYRKKSDPRYTEMTDFANKWGLTGSDIDYVYRMVSGYDQAVKQCRLQTGGVMSDDEINQNIGQFTDQISQTLREYLGDERFDTLIKNRIIQFE